MPLLDHFHPPLYGKRHWESFHATWAGALADDLNRRLPQEYFAEEQIQIHPGTAFFADVFEVHVFLTGKGPALVAAIKLISPRDKHRAEARRAFAVKCANYLHQGISLIIVDIVTAQHANLHTEIMDLVGMTDPPHLPADAALYAVAYQPLCRQEREEIGLCPDPLAVGAALPRLPLAISAELSMPVDLEATYMDARRRRRLA